MRIRDEKLPAATLASKVRDSRIKTALHSPLLRHFCSNHCARIKTTLRQLSRVSRPAISKFFSLAMRFAAVTRQEHWRGVVDPVFREAVKKHGIGKRWRRGENLVTEREKTKKTGAEGKRREKKKQAARGMSTIRASET